MMNLRHVMTVFRQILDNATDNSKALNTPMREEDPFIKSLAVPGTITVGQLRGAIEEYKEGDLRIGNTSYRIMAVPKSYEPSKICKLCCFSDEHGRSQRSCPHMTYLNFNRALCTFIGDGDHGYFEVVG